MPDAPESISLPAVRVSPPAHDGRWMRTARLVRWLSYASLVWMLAEGAVGLVAGIGAHSAGVIAWAIGSVVEAAAAMIVIVRLTGANRFSDSAERRAQRWVAASLLVLVPYILYEAITKLITNSAPDQSWPAVALLGSSVILMPGLGRAKHHLGRQLGSSATTGEGTQNLLCALQAALALAGLLLGSTGAGFLDPVAALLIAAIAAREGIELWTGEGCHCHSTPQRRQPSGATSSPSSRCGSARR